MKKLVVLLMAMVIATGAFAQIDPDPNALGLYFDMEATIVEGPAGVPFTTAYLLLTNPTEAYVNGFELKINTDGAYIMGATFAGDVGGANVGGDLLQGTFFVGFNAPVSTGQITEMAELTFMAVGDMNAMFLSSVGVDASLPTELPIIVYSDSSGDQWMHIATTTALPGMPCFIINGTGVVATESMSMGSVKALYR